MIKKKKKNQTNGSVQGYFVPNPMRDTHVTLNMYTVEIQNSLGDYDQNF